MFTTSKAATDYLFGGKAIVTLESEKTGKHFTYRVNKAKAGDISFISILSGPNNMSDYTYVGIMGSNKKLVLTKKSKMTEESDPVKAFNYMMQGLSQSVIPSHLIIRHNGTCGRCARPLTVPSSLEAGIGPECAKKMGV